MLSVFCLDVDGVMTDGAFHYSSTGKQLKRFGPDDGDALKLMSDRLEIHFFTADKRGIEISRARIENDLGYPLHLVASLDRRDWFASRWRLDEVVYMADGFLDIVALESVGYSIAPSNCSARIKNIVRYVTPSAGGDRAVADACFHLASLLGVDALFRF